MAFTAESTHASGPLHERTSIRRPEQVYYLYVPRDYRPADDHRLLVTIHGQSRGANRYAEGFAEFADAHRYVVLAPLFPSTIRYQELGIGGERADLRLLELIEEVCHELELRADHFDLFGYSGGAQFAHRFLYVQPNRLRSVIVGAPGTVTLPTRSERWPVGVAGLGKLAGSRFKIEAVRRPRTLLMVGADDIALEGLNQSPWAMRAGATRLGRARSLHAAWLVAGIEHEYVELAATSHGLDRLVVDEACRFLLDADAR